MKTPLLIIVFALTVVLGFSQDSRISKGLTIEPFIAYSSSTFIDGDVPESAYLSTFALGLSGNYYFNDTWSLRSGIIKDKIGGSLFGIKIVSSKGTFFLTSEVLEQDFITIPIQANWHFGKRKRWNLAFGMSYSLAIGEKLEFGDQVYSSFLAGAIDIGYKYPVGPGHMTVSISAIARSENENSIFSGQRRGLASLGYEYAF